MSDHKKESQSAKTGSSVCFSSLPHQGGKQCVPKMQVFFILVVTTLVYSRSSPAVGPSDDECRKVPTIQMREECTTHQIRVETTDTVEECKDMIVTECKQKFSHFPHRTFSSSRILGTTSTMVASGVPAKYSYSKREEGSPLQHKAQGGGKLQTSKREALSKHPSVEDNPK